MTSRRSNFMILTLSLIFVTAAAPSTFARYISITNPSQGDRFDGEFCVWIAGNFAYDYFFDVNPYYVHLRIIDEDSGTILLSAPAGSFYGAWGAGTFGEWPLLQPGPCHMKITAELRDFYYRTFDDRASTTSVGVIVVDSW